MFGFTTTDSKGVEIIYTRPLMQTLLMFVAMSFALPLTLLPAALARGHDDAVSGDDAGGGEAAHQGQAKSGEEQGADRVHASELRDLIVRHPALIGCSYEANLAPTAAALQRRLQLSDDELIRTCAEFDVVSAAPTREARLAALRAQRPTTPRQLEAAYDEAVYKFRGWSASGYTGTLRPHIVAPQRKLPRHRKLPLMGWKRS